MKDLKEELQHNWYGYVSHMVYHVLEERPVHGDD